MLEDGGFEVAAAASNVESVEVVGATVLALFSVAVVDMVMLAVTETTTLESVSVEEAASSVVAGQYKQEQAEARRCPLLFLRPKL